MDIYQIYRLVDDHQKEQRRMLIEQTILGFTVGVWVHVFIKAVILFATI